MKNFRFPFPFYLLFFVVIFFSCRSGGGGPEEQRLQVAGLREPVEVVRDRWGVNHIYARNTHDLFFAQGYLAARDRLFQFEIWRRQATGTVAELLGPREVRRDIGTRLFRYRGDMEKEMSHYHPQGKEIIGAYTAGVNAYVGEVRADTSKLTLPFRMLGILPDYWTPEVVISRHQGLLGNIQLELRTGLAVARLGADAVNRLAWFHPRTPDLHLDAALDASLLTPRILDLYNAYRTRVTFLPEDLLPAWRRDQVALHALNAAVPGAAPAADDPFTGSNNWVVSASRMADGNTYMANDPHRTIAIPSLRYMVHLVAPHWDVAGAGEPEIPGVSIGHNDYGAWGLTVFFTDGEDLMVYDLNPDNVFEYKYKGSWKAMEAERDTIRVKGTSDVPVVYHYTVHGPVCYIDTAHLKAYAVRCAWLEPGGAPYLASLRMDQAKSWEAFREACSYSNIPGENMVWAGRDGTIGWQAVGIAPRRTHWSGLVPVPGDGRYEWDGYLPIKEKPHRVNPPEGFIATANQNITPPDYPHWEAIGYSWRDPYRGDRLNEVLRGDSALTMDDMKALQTDYTSLPARQLVPLLEHLELREERLRAARGLLAGWDYRLDSGSVAAGIYNAWENSLMALAQERFVPSQARGLITLALYKVISWIREPQQIFPAPAEQQRDAFLAEAFRRACDTLTAWLGPDAEQWQLGNYHYVLIRHALTRAARPQYAPLLDAGPAPRGGNAYCPNVTGNTRNQHKGASFRIIVNTGDWDCTQAMNTPGQSGDPESPFYENLFDLWAKDRYFPLYYSKEKIESVAAEHFYMEPIKR